MAYKKLNSQEPLYFFYDCETTGLKVGEDKIIEIAAVIHTNSLSRGTGDSLKRGRNHEFSSLCYCEKELSEEAQRLTGLTLQDLKYEPKIADVLNKLFDWISHSVSRVTELERKHYIPVLTAHSGPRLDFPMLHYDIEILGSHPLQRKFRQLNLHYADTHSVFKKLKCSNPRYSNLESLGVDKIYEHYFRERRMGHRALGDARDLCKIFSEALPARELMAAVREHIQTKEGLVLMQEQLPKFHEAWINFNKAKDLLRDGITYERLVQEYQSSSEANFYHFLRNTCGITRPKVELLAHFKEKYP